jgi:hypothetical protein
MGFQNYQGILAFLQVLLLMLKEFQFLALQIQVLLSVYKHKNRPKQYIQGSKQHKFRTVYQAA